MPNQRRNTKGYSQRKLDTREVKQRFLIVCEGSKTEPNYFKSFRVPKNVIDVQGLAESPSKLVQSAKTLRSQEEYDQVWCVFDRDAWTEQNFNNAIHSAESDDIKIAYSNEAFELWYILHFEFLNTGISRDAYKAKLTSLLGKKYEKNSKMLYDDLLDKQNTAIENAEKLLNQYEPKNPVKDNPSTTVHLLVQELNRFIT